jgi:OmpA-OmpF porin, OOP family
MKKPIALAISLALAPAFVNADDSSFLMYMGGGLKYLDSDLNMSDRQKSQLELGLGYRINPTWEIMVRGGRSDAWFTDHSIDTRYNFDPEEEWQPVLTMGLGENENIGHKQSYMGLGLGVQTMLTNQWDFRAGYTRQFGIDDNWNHDVVTMGVTYFFSAIGDAAPIVEAAPEPVPAPSLDSDNDGVMNEYDRCPNSPAGAKVDSTGCTIVEAKPVVQENPDKDGDGVLDVNDSCLNSPAGSAVDATGCAKKAIELAELTLKIEFATNSSEIRSSYENDLKDLAELVAKYPNAMIQVEGHTDSMGKATYNKWLSERRAESVKQYLMTKMNLDSDKIYALGFGEEQPVATNDTAEGRQTNRRVIAKIVYR